MKTEEQAKKIIEALKPMQIAGERFPCPRCGYDRMDEQPIRNALSRYADVYVCNECGTDEALRDMKGDILPLNKWSIAT